MINRKIDGWANFYQFVHFKAQVFHRIDRVVFWKLAHWLAAKYRMRMKPLMRRWIKRPTPSQAKTWLIKGKDSSGRIREISLKRLVGRGIRRAYFPSISANPYLYDSKFSIYSSFDDVVMAFMP